MGLGKYILQGYTPVLEEDLMKWAHWTEDAARNGDRWVKHECVSGVYVSTVFLGIDYQWGDGPPLLFETMMRVDFQPYPLQPDQAVEFLEYNGRQIGGWLNYQTRCSTWDEAEIMHKEAVAYVLNDFYVPLKTRALDFVTGVIITSIFIIPPVLLICALVKALHIHNF